MTTEGDGNYFLHRFLEAEGAEVDVQPLTSWMLYLLWQVRYDTQRRLMLRGADGGRRRLAALVLRALGVELKAEAAVQIPVEAEADGKG